jgi:hypothetical protein
LNYRSDLLGNIAEEATFLLNPSSVGLSPKAIMRDVKWRNIRAIFNTQPAGYEPSDTGQTTSVEKLRCKEVVDYALAVT